MTMKPPLLGLMLALALALCVVGGRAYASPEGRPLRVASGHVSATRTKEDGALEWTARWVLAVEELEADPRGTIRFAVPLPPDEVLVDADGARAIVEDGRIVGLWIERDPDQGRIVEATFMQPRLTSRGLLGAPFADGAVLQIFDADLGGGAALEIDRDPALERRSSRGAREEACRLTGYDPRRSRSTLFVRGADVEAVGGLRGTVVMASERTRRAATLAGTGFALLVGFLVLAWRRTHRAAAASRADAVLAGEIEAL